MRHSVLFAAAALLLGAAYGVITPPFEVADEVGHYWRASSIAYGYVATARPLMPQGFRSFVHAQLTHGDTRGVTLQPDVLVPIRAYAFYSPAAYMPQIASAFVARVFRFRPFYGFYLGRLATLVAAVLIVAIASEIAPALRDHLHVVALLPMSLSLFASWSADAMTIAAALLTTALIIAGKMRSVVPASLWLSLCKPSYGLIAFLSGRLVVILAVVIGSALSIWMTMSAAVASPRPGMPIDAAAQLKYIRDDPVRFAGVVVSNVQFDHLKMMVGRFGLADVAPPATVTFILLLLLLAVGVMNGPSLPARKRVTIGGIALAIILAILTYLYVTSSIAGGGTIEGTHGRYLLPILPLILLLFRIPRLRFAVPYSAIIGVTALANLVCIGVLARRYW